MIDEDTNASMTSAFEEYADGIYRYVLLSLPAHIDANDIVQDVFLKAFRAWGTFNHKSSVKTWIYSIARNCIVDELRKHRRESNWLQASRTSYHEPYSELGSMVEYEEILRTLPDKYRQVLVLRIMDGLSYEEIAHVLSRSEASVRTLYHRGKAKLSNLLQQDDLSVQRNWRGGVPL